ncbi:MAG: hypothetical protein N2Z85_01720, partial [Patescibacteria group bacterium]|nr:hypothetical protein [Patescibacteria group bacterium]
TTSTCANLGLPPLPSPWQYRCTTAQNLQKIDGTGWIPIDFNQLSFGRSLSKLPIDPINNTSSFYSYVYNPTINKYEINGMFESNKYKLIAQNDGGDSNDLYEIGSNINLIAGSSNNNNGNNFIKLIGLTNKDDEMYFMNKVSDGGYLVGGYYDSSGSVFFKLDSNLNIVSGKFISISYIRSGIVDSNNNYVILGGYYNPYYYTYDMVLIKFDSNLNLIFAKTIGGSGNESAISVIQPSDGSYLLTGLTDTPGFTAGSVDIFIVKLDSNGNFLWARAIGGSGAELIGGGGFSGYGDRVVLESLDGGYIFSGQTNTSGYGPGYYKIFLFKINSNGSLAWAKSIGSSSFDAKGKYIVAASDNNYLIGGESIDYYNSIDDFLVIKIDASGNSILWSRSIGGDSSDYVYAIDATSDGGAIIAGFTFSFSANGSDILVSRLSSSGSLLWTKKIGGSCDEYPVAVIRLSSGYLIGANTCTYGVNAFDFDFYFINLDSSGNINNCNNIVSVTSIASSTSFSISTINPQFNFSITSTSTNSFSPTISSPTSPNQSTVCPL